MALTIPKPKTNNISVDLLESIKPLQAAKKLVDLNTLTQANVPKDVGLATLEAFGKNINPDVALGNVMMAKKQQIPNLRETLAGRDIDADYRGMQSGAPESTMNYGGYKVDTRTGEILGTTTGEFTNQIGQLLQDVLYGPNINFTGSLGTRVENGQIVSAPRYDTSELAQQRLGLVEQRFAPLLQQLGEKQQEQKAAQQNIFSQLGVLPGKTQGASRAVGEATDLRREQIRQYDELNRIKSQAMAAVSGEMAELERANIEPALQAARQQIISGEEAFKGQNELLLDLLEKDMARQKELREEQKTMMQDARSNLEVLVKGGKFDLSQLSAPEIQEIQTQTGYSPMMLEAFVNSVKPSKDQVKYNYESLGSGNYLLWGQDPVTGELVRKEYKQEINGVDPADKIEFKFAPDGTPLIINLSKKTVEIAEGYGQGFFADPKDVQKRDTQIIQQIGGDGKEHNILVDKQSGQILADLGLKNKNMEQSDNNKILSPTEAKTLGIPYGTTVGEAIEMGITPETPMTVEDKINLSLKLEGNFEGYAKELRIVQRQANLMKVAMNDAEEQFLKDGSIAEDSQAVITIFNKILDPTSVVKEAEYDRSSASLSILDRLNAIQSNVKRGGPVSIETLRQYGSLAEQFWSSYNDDIVDFAKRTETQTNNWGLSLENILTPNTIDVLRKSGGIEQVNVPSFIEFRTEIPGLTEDEYNEYLKLKGFSLPSAGGGTPQSFISDPGTSEKGLEIENLGSLSEKFESGGDPGVIGYDATGGYSYGTYQLAHQSAKNFINQSKWNNDFKGLTFNSKEWQDKWKEIAGNESFEFGNEQKVYVAKTHYIPQINKLKEFGINTNNLPQVLQDVIWSTAVQHGPNTDVIIKAFKKVGKGKPIEDYINAIYDERSTRFGSSTENIQNAVKNRFVQEKKLALNRLV